jgi:hypothetical protein
MNILRRAVFGGMLGLSALGFGFAQPTTASATVIAIYDASFASEIVYEDDRVILIKLDDGSYRLYEK